MWHASSQWKVMKVSSEDEILAKSLFFAPASQELITFAGT
jgi:hypothetical protein